MLDQMSGGRLELGFGRGASPIEIEYLGIDPATAQDILRRGVEVIVQGLTQQDARLPRQVFHLQRRADGDAAAATAAPADLVRRPRAGQRRPRRAPRAQCRRCSIRHRRARVAMASYRATWRATARRGADAQARARSLRRRGRDRRGGAAAGAPRLSACGTRASRYLFRLHGRPQNPSAARAISTRSWSAARALPARPRPSRIPRRTACRDRLQLCRRAIRLRRHDARRMPALHRPVRQRGHAGVAGGKA